MNLYPIQRVSKQEKITTANFRRQDNSCDSIIVSKINFNRLLVAKVLKLGCKIKIVYLAKGSVKELYRAFLTSRAFGKSIIAEKNAPQIITILNLEQTKRN